MLLVLEAMKMENEIIAPHDSTVPPVMHVTKGEERPIPASCSFPCNAVDPAAADSPLLWPTRKDG